MHTYTPGGSFGELALLYNQPRAASIVCKEAGTLYALDRASFRAVLRRGNESTLEKKLKLLKQVEPLAKLTTPQMQALCSILLEEKYVDGQCVCNQGEPADSLYVVSEGLVHQMLPKVLKRRGGMLDASNGAFSTLLKPDSFKKTASASQSPELITIRMGEYFGAASLEDEASPPPKGAPLSEDRACWPGDVLAVGAVTLLRLKRADFVSVFGDLTQLTRENFQKRVLGGVEMFNSLTASELAVLVEALAECHFEAGEVILKEGEPGESFYIVRSGEVRACLGAAGGWPGEVDGVLAASDSLRADLARCPLSPSGCRRCASPRRPRSRAR